MYPKVKVREDRDEDHKRDVAVDHKVFASLPIRVSSSSPPVKEEQQDVSPPFVPRIQNTRVLNAVNVTPTVSNSREPEKHDRKVDEKDRSNIRLTSSSSSVLRPRAVLSSPDNDAMIGNKNKIGANRSKVLRNHNFIQNRHVSAQCKVAPSTKSQMHTNLSNEASDKKSDLKGKTSSVMVTPTQRSLRPGKSCFVKT